MDDKSNIKELCAFCFDTLLASLQNKKESVPDFPKEFTGKSYPLFVTWYKGKNQDLRGCIGTFKSALLDDLVGKYALISAFEDYRFKKISLKEVADLSCSVSLLTDFEKANSAFDWEIGKHGIQIQFSSGGSSYGGTFLPEVAKEQGWDHETTLDYLVRKAGYHGSLKDVVNQIQTTRYQSKKTVITFEEYKQMRKESKLLEYSV